MAVIPALINALVGALQELDIWKPLPTAADISHHLRSTAFIGNPNDAGGYLAVVTVASLAAAVVSRSSRKSLAVLTGLLVAGLLINQTLAAIMATTAGMIALLALVSWKRAAVAVIAIAIVLISAVAILPPLHDKKNSAVILGHSTPGMAVKRSSTGRPPSAATAPARAGCRA